MRSRLTVSGTWTDLADPRAALEHFRVAYCLWLAVAVAVQLPRQVRHVQRCGEERRLPPFLNLVPIPRIGATATLAVGLLLVVCLGAAATHRNVAPALLLGGALLALWYFPQVIGLPEVRRKSNTVPIILLLLGVAGLVPAPGENDAAHVCRWTIQLVVAQVYFAAGVMKLRHAGLRWADGATLRTALLRAHLTTGNRAALALARQPGWLRLAAGTVLAFDLTFWLMIPFPRLAWGFVPLGLGFHLATALLQRIHYWIYLVPAYFVFIRW